MRFVILTVVMFWWGFSETTFGEEEKTDDRVFGLRWKMSAQEIVKLRLGKLKDIRNSLGKSELEFENPKSPQRGKHNRVGAVQQSIIPNYGDVYF